MIELLLENPLLLLFVVAAVGWPLGKLKVKGSSLGVAAVLFVGLGAGSLHPELRLPEIVPLLGLTLFVYTIGLSSGPGFFASFRRKGIRDNLLVAGVLTLAWGLAFAAALALGLTPALAAGLFAGSLTNTPALASALEFLKGSGSAALTEPVVGYSIAYPMGVVGMILAVYLLQRLWRVDYAAEAGRLRDPGAAGETLQNRTIRVTRPEAVGRSIRELVDANGWEVLFGRLKRGDRLGLAEAEHRLEAGDVVTVIGSPDTLERVTRALGEASPDRIDLDRSEIDYRRIFVSNPKIAGHRLRELDLPQHLGAIVTRIRRGDVELLPRGGTVLELGDRVRVLTHRDRMPAVTRFFGDSYRAISEIDMLTFSLGLALGLLLGTLPIPLPGGITIRLGLAGGPLIVALVLGWLGRSGPLVWSLPYGANLILRQFGLILFLGGIGTRSGYAFVQTLAGGGGFVLLAAGAAITCTAALALLWVGYRILRIPMGVLTGMLAGMQTQPAVLGFALEQSGNDLPNLGYATVFPIAMILKIVLVQLLLVAMGT